LIVRIRTYRFEFRALDHVVFPPGKAGNTLRGALGMMLRTEAELPLGMPSGLRDPPRPFALRAWHLDGRTIQPGGQFHIGIHEFDIAKPMGANFRRAFEALGKAGLGVSRGRFEMVDEDAECRIEAIDLAAAGIEQWARVRFVTPTDLKGEALKSKAADGEIPFGVLFARVRDRIATLSRLYGGGSIEIDYAAMGARASGIRTVQSSLKSEGIVRRSSRTGQTHGIGGLIGTVEYAGDLGEFLPWLRAAWWTGAGRHTVWGNGVIEIDAVR
jgi:hypothetical protein